MTTAQHETSKMQKSLGKEFEFKLKTMQTDSDREFCNDRKEIYKSFPRYSVRIIT